MACFLVSAAEAFVVTCVEKKVKKDEKKGSSEREEAVRGSIPFSKKLHWLSSMLWGGAVLLLFEHIWHGEVTPFFPFLTAMKDPGDFHAMLYEMGTVGIGMALLVTAVWAGICITADEILKRPSAGERA